MMKLLKMSFLDFMCKYFAILDNAFNCLVAFLQHLLICSVKVSRLSMITLRTFTLLSELINTSSHNLRWSLQADLGTISLIETFSGVLSCHCHQTILWQFCSLPANYQEQFEDWKRQTTTNYHQYNCTNCNCWWNGTNHENHENVEQDRS